MQDRVWVVTKGYLVFLLQLVRLHLTPQGRAPARVRVIQLGETKKRKVIRCQIYYCKPRRLSAL